MWTWTNFGAVILIGCAAAQPCNCAELTSTNDSSGVELKTQTGQLWDAGIGEGFSSSSETISLEAGPLLGVHILGGTRRHDMVLSSFSYGHMLGETAGRGCWYRGNWELRGEIFGGVEFSPSNEWMLGVTPHLRYNFATGTRWVPFADAGTGVTATSIRGPDLGNTFEFNLQATVGTHIFLRENLALTIEARFMHISSAGIWSPNHGVNGFLSAVGFAILF